MTESKKSFDILRNKFLSLRDQRVAQFKDLLNPVNKDIVDILPLLLHYNTPLLPGFISTETPCGIADYQPGKEALAAALKYAKNIKLKSQSKNSYPIRGIFLMGSSGSLGQGAQSDMDVWLCHSDNITESKLSELKEKSLAIEAWAESLKVELHIFLMHAEGFRDGQSIAISSESSGSIQQHSLLDEFYRSNILLAGLPPLWWIVPPDEEKNYSTYTKRLISHRFFNESDWLDFGGMENTPIAEFFGAAFWQLHKAINDPYKALLKLFLIETYVSEHPNVNWISHEFKNTLFNMPKITLASVDPYVMMLDKVTGYLENRGEKPRVKLIRRAFYFKCEIALSKRRTRRSWKFHQLTALTKSWGWNEQDLILMDARASWKLERVIDERNALVAELSRSYRLLTEHTRQNMPVEGLNIKELALLGKKLYSALERRPGKIDNINPGISRNLSEPWLHIKYSDDIENEAWLLYKLKNIEPDDIPIKATHSLIELLTWIIVNGLIDSNTRIQLTTLYKKPNYKYLTKNLETTLSNITLKTAPLEAFDNESGIVRASIFINAEGKTLERKTEDNYQLTSQRNNPLSYGASRQCLVNRLDTLSISSWGEILVKSYYEGQQILLDCICEILNSTQHISSTKKLPISFIADNTPRELSMAKYLNQLLNDFHLLFHQKGKYARYVLTIATDFYLLYKKIDGESESIQWKKFKDEKSILIYFSRSPKAPTTTYIDDYTLADKPISFLFQHFVPNTIQVYYQQHQQDILYYLLDEKGGLYFQHITHTDEKHFVVQQARFLNSIITRRLITTDNENTATTLENNLQFFRLASVNKKWKIQKIKVPPHQPGDYLDLALATAPSGPWKDGFSLILGDQEYNSLVLGANLYSKVATHILSQRKNAANYRIFLTNVISFGLDQQQPWSIGDMLNFKYILEDKLNKALEKHLA